MEILNDIQIQEIERKNKNPLFAYVHYTPDYARIIGAVDWRFAIYLTSGSRRFEHIFEVNINETTFYIYRDWYFNEVIQCKNLREFFALTPPVPEILLTSEPEFENQLSFF